ALARLPGVENIQANGSTTRFRTLQTTVTLAALTHLIESQRAELIDLQVRKATLEDVFLRFTDAEKPTSGSLA
ncbi:MAG: hypothetical protein ABIV50_15210, partial [Opitutus sp.]